MTSLTPPPSVKLRPYAVIVAIFMVIEFTGVFEQVMVYTAIPTLMKAFQLDAAAISWAVTVFLLVGAGTAAIAGRLGDIYGRKKVLVALMIISAVGSIISIIAGNFEGILVGRALQGTSAALFPLLAGIARETVPAPRVPVLISLTTGVSIIGGSLAALAAGILLDTSGWHSIFVASGILAIIALLVALGLPRSVVSTEPRARLDILGAVVMAPAIAAILFGVNTARSQGASALVIGLIGIGAILFAFWIVWELRIKNPMFNLRLFKRRSLVLTLVATAAAGLGIFAATALITPILQQSPASLPVGLGLTPTEAGLYGLISGVLGFALSPVGGRIASKFGAKVTLALGFGIAIIGSVLFIFSVHSLPLSIVAVVVTGLGTALILVGIPNIIVELVSASDTSEAVGLIFSVGRTLFAAIGTAIVGIILASSTVPGTTAPSVAAWNSTLIYVIITAVIGLIVTIIIRKVKPMDQRGTVVEAVAEVQAEAASENPVISH
ncbi:MFS transporter [Subtercola endophyticus]|uniref:MFS transporter n=1 Tax=Subtercola endophyticus TaxID=2895559 RepID=UPI001E3431A1|nr:MFS transporter [Subtercola endophyticus]UFS58752.1 MFS transporter [Subtercola endophyticus]